HLEAAALVGDGGADAVVGRVRRHPRRGVAAGGAGTGGDPGLGHPAEGDVDAGRLVEAGAGDGDLVPGRVEIVRLRHGEGAGAVGDRQPVGGQRGGGRDRRRVGWRRGGGRLDGGRRRRGGGGGVDEGDGDQQ